jgi:hypothetical protein
MVFPSPLSLRGYVKLIDDAAISAKVATSAALTHETSSAIILEICPLNTKEDNAAIMEVKSRKDLVQDATVVKDLSRPPLHKLACYSSSTCCSSLALDKHITDTRHPLHI